jgi:hypothetical protein
MERVARHASRVRNLLWAGLAWLGYIVGGVLGFLIKTVVVCLVGVLSGFVAATGWTILIGWMRDRE